MEFEWDPRKEQANRRKHGIGFREAATVFGDALSTTFPDPDHSFAEQRFLTIGMSGNERLLVVAHTQRGAAVRIINAREVTHSERHFYEEGH